MCFEQYDRFVSTPHVRQGLTGISPPARRAGQVACRCAQGTGGGLRGACGLAQRACGLRCHIGRGQAVSRERQSVRRELFGVFGFSWPHLGTGGLVSVARAALRASSRRLRVHVSTEGLSCVHGGIVFYRAAANRVVQGYGRGYGVGTKRLDY